MASKEYPIAWIPSEEHFVKLLVYLVRVDKSQPDDKLIWWQLILRIDLV